MTTTFAIELIAPGGVECFRAATRTLTAPGPGEVRIRHTAMGVNFVDIYQRTGLYPVGEMPAVLGVEGAGVVEEIGADVHEVAAGDRVAYAGLPLGGYAQGRNIPASRLVRIPDGVDDRIAAAAMLRGVTAHMLLRRVFPVGTGTTMLLHAAAGGLGLLVTAWAKRLGARVIGTAGSPAKADLALAQGADHVILYREQDFVAEVRRLTDGCGVDFAIDGIGGETLARTLDAVHPFGMVASIGQASGALPHLPLTELGPRRSLAVSRPSVFAYAADLSAYRRATKELFGELVAGLPVTIGAELPLARVADAHIMLERGETTGSLLLVP
ncbi:quinone oxidoreductase [Xanthobacter autotrophicus]|uniref:quinone oxidoreductase family protein n=1 Tax=Xanthobacter autotrophicus TaxID=280 RepID=UPI001E3A0E9B|nr:quinone oxidoreductase [Xanthobacter autotrophicus]UDQ87742.1 quinone oxidoreductase [Xanthobacter autotrophicus]